MNETMSLLIATAILATGGLGLYMYKSSENEAGEDREYDEKEKSEIDSDDTGFFGKGGFFSSSSEDAEDEEEHIRYEPKPKARSVKTKRNRRSGGTKRRY